MKEFTSKEIRLLRYNNWEIVGVGLAEKNWRMIRKFDHGKFVVETWMVGSPDDNDYWEWDSEHETVEKAIGT